MKIVLTTKHFLPTLGGSINYAVMLAGAFRRLGAEVVVMTRTPGTEGPVAGCEVMRRPGWKRHFELAKWADVVFQVEASWRDVWPFLLRGVHWFPTLHCGKNDKPAPLKTRLANFGLAIAYQLGHTIPVGDQVARDWNVRGEPIHNPYDDTLFHPPTHAAERGTDLLFVGRIVESKGVFLLLEALRSILPRLEGEAPPLCCFVGTGEDDEVLLEKTASFGAGIRFEHAGRLQPAEVADRMRDSKILVFPTTPDWVEASPLTPLEALGCGCRVVAADSGGTRENIGPDGMLVPSGDVVSLADAILRLLTDPPPRNMESVARFLEERRLDRVARKYLERFESALR